MEVVSIGKLFIFPGGKGSWADFPYSLLLVSSGSWKAAELTEGTVRKLIAVIALELYWFGVIWDAPTVGLSKFFRSRSLLLRDL